MLSNSDAIRVRIILISLLLVPVAVLLAIRLYYVQVIRHPELLEQARKQYTLRRTTFGKRGEIYDVRGNLLVGNVPCIHVLADPAGYADNPLRRRRAAQFLARELELDYRETFRKLRPDRKARDEHGVYLRDEHGDIREVPVRYAMLARNLSLEEGMALEAKAKQEYVYSLFFREGYSRSYPKGRMLSNILGFTRLSDDREVPVMGVEKAFNRQLAPQEGEEEFERSRDGRPLIYGRRIAQRASQDGWGVVLTVDERLQAVLEEELDLAYEKWQPKSIYGILADPYTGNILAIAQRPTFDPGNRKNVESEAWRLRFLEDGLEPGSIIKPITIANGLDAGVITPDSRFDCHKGLWYYLGKPLRDTHANEILTVSDIIKVSSNIGTAKVALEMGPDLVEQGLRKFGFGERCGLPLRPESRGIFPTNRRQWNGIGLTRYPIGYGILVTPVQMVRAYCALANGGRLFPLRLVDRLIDPETHREHKLPLSQGVQLFRRPETHTEITTMMAQVTQRGGTGTRAAIPGYTVAAKSGTSRKYVAGHGYASGKYFASFAGFVPAGRPAFVMMVTVDEPKGSIYGGSVAGPVFKAVAERALKLLNVPPDAPKPEVASR